MLNTPSPNGSIAGIAVSVGQGLESVKDDDHRAPQQGLNMAMMFFHVQRRFADVAESGHGNP